MGKKHTRTDDKAKSRTTPAAARDPESKTAQTGYDRRAQSSADKNTNESKPKGR